MGGVEWLPGLRSGLRPLMSIRPFGAYCRVRGLDFHGDRFHLLKSSLSLSVSTSLHLHLPPPAVQYVPLRLFFLTSSLLCLNVFLFFSYPEVPPPFLLPFSHPPLNLTVSVFEEQHQDQHDPL